MLDRLRREPGPRKLVVVAATAWVVWVVARLIDSPWAYCRATVLALFEENHGCPSMATGRVTSLALQTLAAVIVLGVTWLVTGRPESD